MTLFVLDNQLTTLWLILYEVSKVLEAKLVPKTFFNAAK